MAVYCEVFQRLEKKYRLTAEQRTSIESILVDHMRPDSYGETRITSLYLDTPDRSLIGRSVEKPLYKEKLRLRTYGEAAGDELIRAFTERESSFVAHAASDALDEILVFCEIKKKLDGVVYKRRMGMSLAAARAFLDGADYVTACQTFPLSSRKPQEESLCARSVQIAAEFEAMMQRHAPLEPSMVITCDRVAWKPLEDQSASPRITFDENLSYRDLTEPGKGRVTPIISADESIMEIKNAGPYPLWLAEALSTCEARPTSFSKYGTVYQSLSAHKALAGSRKEGGCCA